MLFGVLTLWVDRRGPVALDAGLLEAASVQLRPAWASNALQFFGSLGSPLVAAAVLLLAACVVWRNVGRVAALIVLATGAAPVVSNVLARLVGATRAEAELGMPGGGYPSDHVTFAAATFTLVGWLGRRHRRPEVAWIAALLTLGMGFARVADRSHLFDEALGGYLLGGAWALALVAWATRAA